MEPIEIHYDADKVKVTDPETYAALEFLREYADDKTDLDVVLQVRKGKLVRMGSKEPNPSPKFEVIPWGDKEYLVTVNGRPAGATLDLIAANVVGHWLESGWSDLVENLDKKGEPTEAEMNS